ncbi:uncharacterized protein LOC115884298 [Sitophilus oryzae]|uniref:Uncharacterized protein LOC115884298 n=1 Tax=Sitophilus oryzae TaxID=7048 RepID=A0A6J2Y6K4_SITOR|nr:uncharacterized protein LOC115884298 [Sitophilus oryzae]
MLPGTMDLRVLFFVGCVVIFGGIESAPRPCPQFLPVAVRLDNPYIPHRLRNYAEEKDENDNLISGDLKNYHNSVPLNDLLPEIKEPQSKIKETPQEVTSTSPKTESTTTEAKLLKISTYKSKASKPRLTRRRKNSKHSAVTDSPKIILDQNSSWMLKSINDKPAQEVLITDKASIARDLKDSTESSLVLVHKLDDAKP